ncbi:MAG: hypothetical protein HZB64_01085 [Rhodocyclales bacterium]|nr:hypothetical protein [Rhodocyclales bacterium]
MNTAAVFVSMLFWTWLWGVWSLLLSIPITVIVMKVVAQHVKQLELVTELPGNQMVDGSSLDAMHSIEI